MEFPTEWSVFKADEFETAAPLSHGKAVMELMIQARPNGRLLDHFRIATGGSEILEAKFQLNDIISNAKLDGVTAQFQFWGRDANLRRNMTTSAWLDVYGLIKSNKIKLESESGETMKPEELVIKIMGQAEVCGHQSVCSCGPAQQDGAQSCRPCLCPWPW
jgi:hypothetical protein